MFFIWVWLGESSTESDDAESVVLKVFEAVSAALDELHFSVEAFGDAIVFGEAPHAGNLFTPAGESFGQGGQWSEATLSELLGDAQEPWSMTPALASGLAALSKQRTEPLHLIVERADGREGGKEVL